MIYTVKVDGTEIFGETTSMELISPQLEDELNTSGNFQFTFPPTHKYYNIVKLMKSDIEVYELSPFYDEGGIGDEEEHLIWYGRAVEQDVDFYKQKTIHCEGPLSYFYDSVLQPIVFDTISLHSFFKYIIGCHNDQVTENRQFKVGNITVNDHQVYRELNFTTAHDAIQNMCIDTDGGYLFFRKENGINYIDWCKAMPTTSNQKVEFAWNLLDLQQNFDASEIATQLIPLGDTIELETVGGSDSSDKPTWEDPLDSVNFDTMTEKEQEKFMQQRDLQYYEYMKELDEWNAVHKTTKVKETSAIYTPDKNGTPLTVASVNNGSIVIKSDAVSTYGAITKVQNFEGVIDPAILLAQGTIYLANTQFDNLTIECDAAEMHVINPAYESYHVGQEVHCISNPHLLDRDFPISKISIELNSGTKKITLGTLPKKTLSQINKKNVKLIEEISEWSNGIDEKTDLIMEDTTSSIRAGDVPIIPGDDGNDYAIGVDGNGNLTAEKIPSYMRVSKMPDKTQYQIGEEMDYTGVEFELVYKDGSVESVPREKCTIIPPEDAETAKEGVLVCRVSYVWGDTSNSGTDSGDSNDGE